LGRGLVFKLKFVVHPQSERPIAAAEALSLAV